MPSKPDTTARHANQLTVLTTLGVLAVKTYKRNGKRIDVEGYGRAKNFTAETIDVDDRGKWLRRLRDRRNSFVVLGAAKDWKRGEKKRRLSSDRDDNAATIEDVPRGWMPIDVDAIDFTPFSDIDDGEGFALELLDRLKLSGTRCVWHLTNSHGFFDRYRARLWIELVTPMTAAEMKAYAKERWGDEKVDVDGKQKAIVDLAVYQCQQPIYTGDPVLVGVDDPVTRRVGFIEGDALDAKVTASSRKKRGEAGEDDDDNIAKLKAAGIYIGQLKPGQHMIDCPWEDDHSGDRRDDDTFYFQPHFNGHDIPAFKCHHGSCEEKKWADVLLWMGESPTGSFEPVDDGKSKKPKGWVFVYRLGKFRDPRDGALIDRDAFDAKHGGGGRNKPSDRFIADSTKLKADRIEFRPDRADDLLFDDERGVKVVNTYTDRRVKANAVDYSRIIEHVEWMLPDRDESRHLLDFMAWCYRNPGNKVTWAPLLYGVPGTGKTLIFDAFARCIGHHSAPTTKDLRKTFDTFAFEKLVVRIEELKCDDQFSVVERMKPIITNDTIDVELKYIDTTTVRNFANVVATTNHADALPIEEGERRWCLMSTINDLAEVERKRQCMRDLKLWLDTRDGLGAMAQMFADRDLTRFQPKGIAPETALKREAAVATMTKARRAELLMKQTLSDEPIVTTSIVQRVLEDNDCDYGTRRFGLLASKLRWLSFEGGGEENRLRCGGKSAEEAVWSPTRKQSELDEFRKMSVADRKRYIEQRIAKLTAFDAIDEADDKVVSLKQWKNRKGQK